MDWLLAILLFLHIGGGIVAFGPSFTFPIIGAKGGREREHVNFALRLQELIASRLVLPLALFQGVTGLALIWKVRYDVFATGWLLLGILLYLVAISTALFVSLPTVRRLIAMTSGSPPAPPVGAPPAGGPPPAGPPPQVAALARRGRLAGFFQLGLIVAIVFLMVVKP
jgi:uncharacterized membrane protein